MPARYRRTAIGGVDLPISGTQPTAAERLGGAPGLRTFLRVGSARATRHLARLSEETRGR